MSKAVFFDGDMKSSNTYNDQYYTDDTNSRAIGSGIIRTYSSHSSPLLSTEMILFSHLIARA